MSRLIKELSVLFVFIVGCTSTAVPSEHLSPTPSVEAHPPLILQTPTINSSSLLPPTLSASDAEDKLLNLLNNDDCYLPCFLKMVPGRTEQKQAISMLHQFDNISSGAEITIKRDDLMVSLDVITQDGYSSDNPNTIKWIQAGMLIYRQLDSGVEKVYQNKYYDEYFGNYTLSSLLSMYGVPDDVYIFLDTGIEDMGLGVDLYLLHLDYSSQGWVAHFEMPLHIENNLYMGCPSEAFTTLRLWSPDKPSRDYELDPKILFTVEEATGLTLNEFYQRFKNPTTCLETSVGIHK